MNRIFLALLFVSGCSMGHLALRDGDAEVADGAVTADGSSDDAAQDAVLDGGEAAVDPDAGGDAVADSADPDAGTDTGSDAETDAEVDVGTDAGTDAAPDVTPTCATNETWCGSSCVAQSFSQTSCGDCSLQSCASNQSCERNAENRPTCCSTVLFIPGGTIAGHCPEGSCPTGRCFSLPTGFSDITWYCCPAS